MHLLFDLDGTLTDPKEGITNCIRYALSKLDIDIPQDTKLEWFIGPPLLDTFTKLCGNELLAKEAVAIYRERFSTIGLFENKLYPGIPACLGALSEHAISIDVATSKPTIFAKKIIEHFGLTSHFSEVFGSNLDGSLSDKTELLEHIISRKKLDRTKTVMIGDRSFDIAGAKNNQVKALGVLWGYGTEEKLTRAGADILCANPNEISQKIYG